MSAGSSFRVATYNIHKCRGLDRRVRPKRIAEVLKEIDADVVALQEVVGMDEAAREHNQVHSIADELGMDFRIGENRRLRGGAYGNAVLSRLPIVGDKNHDLTCRRYEPRGCLEVAVQVKPAAEALRLFNVHLGTSFFERRYQAHRLFEVIGDQQNPSTPRIVLGDFNEWTRGLTTRLLSYHLNSAEPEQRLGRARTYPGVFPILHLDHVYYNSSLKLDQVSVHRSRLALAASDHLPIVAGFTLDR
ncbi:MAG TPA: endonuclease/exonuclease/phosphatase family protein [Pyrinomonadaceae bacterium]|nr:endonuclease/exonuclease/phosphatase family protein [Pyrinomonadaceae bacterium]